MAGKVKIANLDGLGTGAGRGKRGYTGASGAVVIRETRTVVTGGSSTPAPSTDITYVAGATVAARDALELYDDAGTPKVRPANASNGRDPECFATTGGAAGATITVIRAGILDGFSGLSTGSYYVLSATVAGAITMTAPSTSGHRIWRVAEAISATAIRVRIELVGEIP